MVEKREQVSEKLGRKDERDYNMMRREREGRSRARAHVSCLNVSIERHSSQMVMKLRFVGL